MDEYRLRFTGERFDSPGFPLECMPELATFQNLVVLASREMYSDANKPEGSAVPDFSEYLELRLTALEAGSVIPVLSMGNEPVLPGLKTRLEESLLWLEDAFTDLLQEPKSATKYSKKFLNDIYKFGETLTKSEAIELGMESNQKIRWTREESLRIQNANLETLGSELRLTLIGSISMLDRRKKFKLLTLQGGIASGEFDTDELYENFWDVLSSAKAEKAVWVDCRVTHSGGAGGKIKITEVFDLSELGPLEDSNVKLLDSLITDSALSDPVQVFPSPDAIFGAYEFLSQLPHNGFRAPLTFLDDEGGFNFDWSNGTELLSLLIENDGNFIGYFKNFETGVELKAEELIGPAFALDFIRGIETDVLVRKA